MKTIVMRQGQNRCAGAALAFGLLSGIGLLSPSSTIATAHASTRLQSVEFAGRSGGDIPDSAVYLRYRGHGVSVEYVEGWVQTTTARGVVFSDKDSLVAVELSQRVSSLASFVRRTDLPRLAHAAGFRQLALTHDRIAGRAAFHVVYRSLSAPDAVTGKTVVLQNDRYYVGGSKSLAILTLSTPLGIDNADGFRRIAHSFHF